MKIIPNTPTPITPSIKVGDIVVYEEYGTHIVLTYGVGDDRKYGLVNLSTGNWSSVSGTLAEVLDKVNKGRDAVRITSNDSWTLTENPQ